MDKYITIKTNSNNEYIYDTDNNYLYSFNSLEEQDRIIEMIEKSPDNESKPSSFKKLTKQHITHGLANCSRITFEVTTKCNLNCSYCIYGDFYRYSNKSQKDTLDFNLVKRFILFMQKKWNSNLNQSFNTPIDLGFYGGEPLMNISLIEKTVEFSKSISLLQNYFSYSMTTNGLLLHKHLDFLIKNKFYLLISLDGDKYNNSYRLKHDGTNSHSKVIENIFLIKKKNPDYFDKYVSFNTVLHNRNSLDSIYDFFNTNFGKLPRISQMNSTGVLEDQKLEFKKTFQNITQSFNKSCKPIALENKFLNKLPHIENLSNFVFDDLKTEAVDHIDLMVKYKSLPKFQTGICIPLKSKIFITSDGKIMPCQNIEKTDLFGEVNETNVQINLDQILTKIEFQNKALNNQCNNCHYKFRCNACAFNFPQINDQIICNYRMNDIDMKSYLKQSIEQLESNPSLVKTFIKDISNG